MFYKKFFLKIFSIGVIIILALGGFFKVEAGSLIGVCSTNKNDIKTRALAKFVGDITGKSSPKVCIVSSSKNDLNLFNSAKNANQSELNGADIVFVKNLQSNVNSGKIMIALDCKSLKYCPNCLGVFYVKNGRTMLVIFEEMLKKLNLKLPSKYNNYVDSKQYVKCN